MRRRVSAREDDVSRPWAGGIAACLWLLVAGPCPAAAADGGACAEAGLVAEQRHQLPPGLLLAIGQVESGRRDAGSGRIQPWPWTIDVAGAGQRFASLPQAVKAVQDHQARGVTSIDIGCFQINLAAHPQAFTRLEQAFDPAANADYAGRFLVVLKQRLGDWGSAIAAYHSATPALGSAYRAMVMAAWGQPLTDHQASPALSVPTVRVVSWAPPAAGVHIWLPSGAAAANVIQVSRSPTLPTIRTAAR